MLYYVDPELNEVISYLETIPSSFDRTRLIGKMLVSAKGETDARIKASARLPVASIITQAPRHPIMRPPPLDESETRPLEFTRSPDTLSSLARRLCSTLERWLGRSRQGVKHVGVPREELAEAFAQSDYLSTALEHTLEMKNK
jgi:hypothetical protein